MLIPLRKAQAEAAEKARVAAEAAEKARVAAEQAAREAQAARVRAFATYGNNYTPGQCTWYVASRINVPQSMGNATSWSYGLSAAGWRSGGPIVGAIGVSHAGYAGHVVIVEAVEGGNVLISEMNGPSGPFVVDTRLAPISDFEYYYL